MAGRPTLYKPEYDDMVFKLALMGATMDRIGDLFGVERLAISEWAKKHPSFGDSLKRGQTMANAEIAHSLYRRGMGYTYMEKQAIKVKTGQYTEEVQIVEVEKEVPGDTTAMIFWLKNKERDQWADVNKFRLTNEAGDDIFKEGLKVTFVQQGALPAPGDNAKVVNVPVVIDAE